MHINPHELIKFTFESIGDLTKISYNGVFEIKASLNFIEKINLETDTRNILNHPQIGEAVHPDIANSAYALALIKAYVVKAPPWFNDSNYLRDFYDENVIVDLFNKINEEAKKWLETIKTEAIKAKKELSSK